MVKIWEVRWIIDEFKELDVGIYLRDEISGKIGVEGRGGK